MKTPLDNYVTEMERVHKAGNATEHTYRPALKNLIEAFDTGITATNEPKRVECGAPDFVISKNTKHGHLTMGYIEAKDVGVSLDDAERSPQLKRYRAHLTNLILTDYLEFRWYVDGELRESARLARIGKDGKFKTEKDDSDAVASLLKIFLSHEPEPVAKPNDLAGRMARLTHMIRDIVIETFEKNLATAMLRDLRKAFADTLIPDLETPEKTVEFADMYAQTIAYGLFAARCNHQGASAFQRLGAAGEIPKTNPFLRKLFGVLTGPDLDDEPYAGFVDDVVSLLAHTDIGAVLENFGKRAHREDPVVHFYETFLATYDPKLRKTRGVYYTPEPVVSYIVRSIDLILKERFGCPDGLADASKVKYERLDDKGKKEKAESHRVLVLDPACGTGTFLYSVVDFIREQYMARGDAGMWSGYVRNHLLPRLFGFELLMAPYAVAHFKLAMQFAAQDLAEPLRKEWAYDFESQERLGIYLTNTLEEAERTARQIGLFERFIAEEADGAAKIKNELPILVVMGNPPYSNFGMMNKGKWILGLLDDYKKDLKEKKLNIDDDFIKFIRWAQWRIDETKAGILAFISNNTYIDGITHRRMRQSLMESFTEIYILDLHGSSKKKENCPDGSKDENVFDIQQGVSIGIFIKEPGKKKQPARVHHAELWGTREKKYSILKSTDIRKTRWKNPAPKEEHYFFVPKDFKLKKEYSAMRGLKEIFLFSGSGVKTERDDVSIHWTRKEIEATVNDFRKLDESSLRKKYDLEEDSRDWKVLSAKEDVLLNTENKCYKSILYRPFDIRQTWYSGQTRGFIGTPGYPTMRHVMAGENISLLSCRQQAELGFRHVFCSKIITECCAVSLKTREITSVFPLYLYPDKEKNGNLFSNGHDRHVNLNTEFIGDIETRLKLKFALEGGKSIKKTFGPEDVFHYIYAVFHSPAYRKRYAEFLKIDFPRVPLTSDVDLFRKLCARGRELVELHLLESAKLAKHGTRYPIAGDNLVEKGHPRYLAPGDAEPGSGLLDAGRVYISRDDPKQGKKGQYFDGVPPEIWEFHIGGYRVFEKWLKDRRDRNLSYEELIHYQKIIVAVKETIRLMKEIDEVIEAHGGWPFPSL